MKKWKQALFIALIIVGVFVVSAIVIGILNATVFDGKINFGWTDYRYENTGYSVGEGTVYANEITSIDVDWLDGKVELISCEDAYLSISEQATETLAESAQVHWMLSADGKTLLIKHRESGWFFGNATEKTLTVRIPKRMLSQLTELSVKAEEAPIQVTDVYAPAVTLSCKKGNVIYSNPECPQMLSIVCDVGDVTLKLAQNESFALTWERKQGRLVSDFVMREEGNLYTVSDGKNKALVQSGSGDLALTALPVK